MQNHMKAAPRRAWPWMVAWLACAGCGGAEPVVQQPDDFEPATDSAITSGGESVAVEGTLGTIPARKIDQRMQGKLTKLSRCFMGGMEDVEQVGGSVQLSFRVDSSGAVEWVFLQRSDVGHRGVERCILDVAAAVRFPQPRGGPAAEFTWGFGLDPADDIRPPVPWTADRVAAALAESPDLAACGGQHTVTAYVAPGGRVLAAGVASVDAEAANAADCVADAVQTLQLDDPGSYPAKVSFALP